MKDRTLGIGLRETSHFFKSAKGLNQQFKKVDLNKTPELLATIETASFFAFLKIFISKQVIESKKDIVESVYNLRKCEIFLLLKKTHLVKDAFCILENEW